MKIKMKMFKRISFLLSLMMLVSACNGDDVDMEYPVIDDENVEASPQQCDTYLLGDTIKVVLKLSDNEELGNYNIEIHSNHDHHTHSTSSVDCELESETEPINPWVFNRSYSIPTGMKQFTVRENIVVPMDVDMGDYHFMVRVTDRAGWQQYRSVAIRII